MSKSYRRPYSPVTGCRSAKQDKLVARRCWRRTQEQALRDCQDYEELVMPKRLEASYNDVWGWGRDGNQSLQFPPEYPHNWVFLFGQDDADEQYARDIEWYKRLCRK